jgi:cysteine-rich repeat protein
LPLSFPTFRILLLSLAELASSCALDPADAPATTSAPEVTGPVTTGTSAGDLDPASERSSGLADTTPAPDASDTTPAPDASDTTTDAGSTGTTGSPAPVCGDGQVDPDLGETCDDTNDDPDDGCHACARDLLVFVSSVVYQGGALDGLAGADQRCRGLAAKADLPRFETYRAWLSSSSLSAADRLRHSPGNYRLVNGLLVARGWDQLTSGALLHPISVDELSQIRDTLVWTGTLPSGQAALSSTLCDDWTTNSADAGVGYSSVTDGWWSFFEDTWCGDELPIYCLEQ